MHHATTTINTINLAARSGRGVYCGVGTSLACTVEEGAGLASKHGSSWRAAASASVQAIGDHLGNNRVLFSDRNGDGAVDSTEIIQENHYYAFGLEMKGSWQRELGPEQRYGYNGKELVGEVGLQDYGARWYDAAVARWTSVDPLADHYKKISPYAYTANNPIRYIDPDGMRIDVDTKEKKDGSTKVKIKYTGVLQTDGVNLSRKELRQMGREIKKQLKSSFSVDSDGVKSKVKVSLRIGGTAKADDNRIILANTANPNLNGADGQAPDGFDAFVNAERGAAAVVKTAVHEVGHNMGLPHNVAESATTTVSTAFGDMNSLIFMPPNTIQPGAAAAGNLMLPGTQVTAAGTNVTASQIMHISQDASGGKLNRRDMGGGGERFGVYPTDRPLVDVNGNVTKQ